MTKLLNGPLLDTGLLSQERDFFENFPLSHDPDYIHHMDDFDRVVIDSATACRWTVVKDAGASVAIQADTLGGRALLSSSATTDDDGSSIQGNEIFKAVSGKHIWFETKLQVSDADQMDVFAGLTVNFATNPEAVLTATDRIGFQINDGDASILCKTEKDGVETSLDSQINAVDATDIVLGFHVIGTNRVEFFVNRILVATHTTNIVDDENLTVALMELSGNATGTKSMAVDYVMVVASR